MMKEYGVRSGIGSIVTALSESAFSSSGRLSLQSLDYLLSPPSYFNIGPTLPFFAIWSGFEDLDLLDVAALILITINAPNQKIGPWLCENRIA